MERIKEAIDSVMRELVAQANRGHPDKDSQALLKKLLTKKEMEHIKLNYFKSGVLSINVDSSVWLYKLNLQKERLESGLKSKLDNFKAIRLRVGEIR